MWFPCRKGWLMPSLLEIGPVALEKKIFKSRQCVFNLLPWSPLAKERDSSFESFIPVIFSYFYCILGANFTLWQTLCRHYFQKIVFKTVIPFFDDIIQTAATLQNEKSPRKSPITVYLMVSVYLLWNVFSDQSKWKSARKVLYEFVYTVYYTVYYIYTIPNTLFIMDRHEPAHYMK